MIGDISFRSLFLTAVFSGTCLLGALDSSAQRAFDNGYALEFFADGVYAPTEMAIDSSGNLFVGSGYEPNWPPGSIPTPIFKVFPDGTSVPFSDPISDPDALTVGPDDNVYVGSYGGVITQVDGITENQSLWLKDSRLKNIDGLRFSPAGDLFAVAIDSPKVHRITPATKQLDEFADLSSLGITGMSGIAFDPNSDHVFVASPLQNIIVELDGSGTIVNPIVASGFLFLGFIDYDPTGKHDGYLFAPDAIAGKIYKVEIATGQKTVIVDQINPGPVGLIFNEDGVLYFNKNFDQVPQGEIYILWDLVIDGPSDPFIGDKITVLFQSRFDEYVFYGAFLGLDNVGPLLPDGRQFPISLNPFVLLTQSMLDQKGEAVMHLDIPLDQSLIGVTAYFAFVTYSPNPFYFLALSNHFTMNIH